MVLGKVVGSIWATQQAKSLSTHKLLLVETREGGKAGGGGSFGARVLAATDSLDAGMGDTVILVGGSSARMDDPASSLPIDATVIAIVDENATKYAVV